MTDKLGNAIKVGDRVAVACLNYKRANLRIGTVKGLDGVMSVSTDVGGHTKCRIVNGKVEAALALPAL
ncbi:hypothetical protein JQ617_08200 [Bradyrhizobium sp. KB893862 SZCCT0404]|uniref:hypothetical protein n=1 Tax=Bradyrhizobium sp. KB893862 SZCCT0404 TaxID=2807672 RepID=UPI001BA80D58|nr:hypothetical protein [Bradyrhizobium sp. KB893862 SZCCT0404]MBR1173931.1 hypothetical protein [Bradyrhizobium sp. KB893862 SZCCT0404]